MTISTDETGCYTLDGQRLYVANRGGRPYIMVRADSLAALVTLMESLDVLRPIPEGEEAPRTLDERRGPRVANITGPLYPVKVPAVTDPLTGDITTPAVVDSRPHINVLFHPRAMENLNEQGVPVCLASAATWMALGSQDGNANASEEGVLFNGAVLLDPNTIATPAVVRAA